MKSPAVMSSFRHYLGLIVRQPNFLGVLATMFVLGMVSSFVSPFLSMWGTIEVGMRPLVFGLFMMSTSLSAIVLSTLLARLSDASVARRSMLLVGAACGALGYLGYAFVRDPLVLTCIGVTALGVASVSFSQLFAHMREEFADQSDATETPLLMSMLRASFSLAWTVGPALSSLVVIRYHYRGIFIAASGLFVLFLLGVATFVPYRPRPAVVHRAVSEPILSVLTRPVIFWHFIGFVLIFAAFVMNMMNLPLTITQQLGGNERDIGIVFGIAPIAEMPLMLWFGRLAARGHQIALIRFGVLVGLVYFLALTLARAPWHIYPMQILSAASIAVTTNVTITFFQDRLPGQTGLATSIYSNSYGMGGLLGYFAFGALVNAVGHRGVFLVSAGLCATALAIFLLYRHREQQIVATGVAA